MKLCIPTMDDRGLEAIVAADFGDASHLTIVDTETGEVVAHERVWARRGRGSGARQATETIRALGADAVLCRPLRRGAAAWFASLNLPVYLTDALVARDAIAAHRAALVRPMTDAAPGARRRHRHRGRGGTEQRGRRCAW